MSRKLYIVLLLVGFAGSLSGAQDSAERATEQNPGSKTTTEKSAREQNPAEKSRGDGTFSDSPFVNFPDPQGPVELRPARGTRITLNLTESSSVIYQNIGQQAKIAVLIDPDYVPRKITVDLNGVSLLDALKIVAFQSRTFWRPVASDAIFIAADNQGKRREFEQQVLKTFYFPNISAPTDLQDIVNSLRTILEIQRLQQIPSHQSILVRATPEQMALAEKIVNDLNQSKQKTGGEYRLDFKINETDKERKTSSHTYSMLIEPRQAGRLRIGIRVPIQMSDKEITYGDIGKNIDCQIRLETEHTVSLHVTVESSDTNPVEHTNPVVQQVKMETSVTLELGTPTLIGNFQDPGGNSSFQIEATAIRTKSKE